ncbi:MAG TPA: hypothetical protein VLF89_02055 [Candidatus Saccharimonadales bacterium]|nr:hypothetical protein [Candidatus Saccharimonadales bacterium]
MSKEQNPTLYNLVNRFNIVNPNVQFSAPSALVEDISIAPLGAHLAADNNGGFQDNPTGDVKQPTDILSVKEGHNVGTAADSISKKLEVEGDIMGVRAIFLKEGNINPIDESVIREGSNAVRTVFEKEKAMSREVRVDLLKRLYEIQEPSSADADADSMRKVLELIIDYPALYNATPFKMFRGFISHHLEIKTTIEGGSNIKKGLLYQFIQEFDHEEKERMKKENKKGQTRLQKAITHPEWGSVMQIILTDLEQVEESELERSVTKKLEPDGESKDAEKKEDSQTQIIDIFTPTPPALPQSPPIDTKRLSPIERWVRFKNKIISDKPNQT